MTVGSRLISLLIFVSLTLQSQAVFAVDFNPNTEHLLPFYRENSTLTLACGGGSSLGGTTAPDNIPEPLRTIFSAAAAEHEADAVMIAVIYATENALYQQDRHLDSDWLIDRVHENRWVESGGGANGPFQFIDSTWDAFAQEGPFVRESNRWTTNTGAGDGVNVNHIDDAAFAAAEFLASIGGVSGVPLGSIDQDFSRGSSIGDTIASALKSYNAGPGTWRENGVWFQPSGRWPESKQREINGYITNGLEMYAELSGIEASASGVCRNLSGFDACPDSGALPLEEMVEINDAVGGTVLVHPCAADAFSQLFEDAKNDNVPLGGFGWRSSKRTEELRVINGCPDIFDSPASSCVTPTARPGTSLHERGQAIDFRYNGSGFTALGGRASPGFIWLDENAGNYDIKNLPSESWHWSTTGR